MSKVKKECHINVKVMKVFLGDAKKLKKILPNDQKAKNRATYSEFSSANREN
jgi:hypothetical protein